jgi:predicted RNA-binding Zn ribbon-like protein
VDWFRSDLSFMRAHSVQTIRLVGGHPALDLLNTVDLDRPPEDRDVLRSFQDDALWAVRVGVLSACDCEHLLDLAQRSRKLAQQAHADLLAARETLRAVLLAEGESASVDRPAADQFERAVAASLANRRFSVAEAPFGWAWLADDLNAVQHRVILSAADLLADTARRPIKICAGPDCDWFFLDTSKAGNRHWCSDAGCGTASRVRRLRQRRAADG